MKRSHLHPRGWRQRLPEILEVLALRSHAGDAVRVEVEAEITAYGQTFPVYSFIFGPDAPELPTVAIIGGVHGLERIGTNLALAYLKTICGLQSWDQSLRFLLRHCRLVFVPLVNPAGMYAGTRCNANGVDLMRNAPLDAEARHRLPLVGGQRWSRHLPWYRGELHAAMEVEAQALLHIIRRELFPSPFALALDLHSGFGVIDRLWFPFAYSHRVIDNLPAMHALKRRLDQSLPNHVYAVEPQSRQYVTHGDLWDYLYLEQRRLFPAHTFLPLTLEMGSWLWVKKNPRQLLSPLGLFNPVLPHRRQRTLRRHHALLDFLLRAAASYRHWLPAVSERQEPPATAHPGREP